MRTLFYLLVLAITASCGSPALDSTTDDAVSAEPSENVSPPTSPAQPATDSDLSAVEEPNPLTGYYVGGFYAKEFDSGQNYSYVNRINIHVQKVEDGRISGRSIVAGNDRPFTGTITQRESGNWDVKAEEPGDDRYDGTFFFTLAADGSKAKGTWVANDAGLAVPQREYELEKRTFSYDAKRTLPEEVGWADLYNGEHPEEFTEVMEFLTTEVLAHNPSVERLAKADVENMYQGDLEVMRNSIYARHGYSFRNRKMRYIFDRYVDWYIPVSTDIRDELTEVEKQNIELIKRYEEHSEKYYDSFGR